MRGKTKMRRRSIKRKRKRIRLPEKPEKTYKPTALRRAYSKIKHSKPVKKIRKIKHGASRLKKEIDYIYRDTGMKKASVSLGKGMKNIAKEVERQKRAERKKRSQLNPDGSIEIDI